MTDTPTLDAPIGEFGLTLAFRRCTRGPGPRPTARQRMALRQSVRLGLTARHAADPKASRASGTCVLVWGRLSNGCGRAGRLRIAQSRRRLCCA